MWLDPGDNPQQTLHLLRPYPAEEMEAYAVSTAVNNPRNEGPQNIEPLGQD
jgi:putative SOS response-associated peptidase YedK